MTSIIKCLRIDYLLINLRHVNCRGHRKRETKHSSLFLFCVCSLQLLPRIVHCT